MSDEHSLSLCRASPEHRDFDLPPPDTKRWVTRRKAVVVNAVRAGVISLEEVCRRYELSVEEFLAWERAIDTHGVPGLRVTRLQIYRDHPPSRVANPRCKAGKSTGVMAVAALPRLWATAAQMDKPYRARCLGRQSNA